MVKKKTNQVIQVTPSSSQICREVQNLAVEGGRDDYLFWMNGQNIFFPAAQTKQILFGG